MTQTIQQSLQEAKNNLATITDNPILEAEILLAYVLGKLRSYLHTYPEQTLTGEQVKQFAEYVQRRCNKEPIAYITGTKEFWSLELRVTPDTLIPRPETELLVESVLKIFPEPDSKIKIADLGTGCGAIALALAQERPKWHIYAADISENALQIARKNAQRLAIKNISFCLSNWCTVLPFSDFDVIVSNPPYIAETEWRTSVFGLAFEPMNALVSGKDGLDAIRKISQQAKHYVKPGGYVLVEHGFLQGTAVREIFAAAGFRSIHTICDLSGQERALSAVF